ncbi:glycosyltransferase [Citrifermentans bemidjiense Bem]|uniref:Glycosyltransferase n=1 Tax=Citrifermentans bemidjiense (strain ATCC BAA-1014 / DSM 16622 / JCM 12645 / Bem) TaxID=404380 RepID=B5EA90_CITBB|nr:glycosyltransferase family 4 protein [Citrifermentans bemidjiense]ACH38796.2 glycosyltransferase [Citrifermentans bemidjiense Bem]
MMEPRPTQGVPRVMDLRGTYKGGGGPDKTVLNSAAQHDPVRVYVLVTYLHQPNDHEFQIPEMAKKLGIDYVDLCDGSTLDLACLRGLAALLDRHRLEVVHAHDDKTLLYAYILRLMRPGLRILYTCHSHAILKREDFASPAAYLKFRARQRLQIWLMGQYLKPVIAVSNDTRDRLVRNGLDEAGVAVLHNGIDTAVWQRAGSTPVLRRELGIGEGGMLVGTVARITPEKDLGTFYQVARRVALELPGVRFAIVGDGYGDELERARREVARLGLEEVVHFTGHRNDLRDVYVSFDVFLMTSVTEGLPNTLLEAMALGVPSVSTDVGGIPELLYDGEGGYLAPAGDAERLALRVLELLASVELRERFSRECRQRIERHFSFGRRVRFMEDYYHWFAGNGGLPDPAAAMGEPGHAG